MFPAIYVSGDALERADAYRLGYRTVCQQLKEIGIPEATEPLVIDFDHILFDDQETAVLLAKQHARRGVLVGLHTYNPQALEVHQLAALPNVLVANTHRQLLVKLGRYARRHGRPWWSIPMVAPYLESEMKHVHDHDNQGSAGPEAVDPVGA